MDIESLLIGPATEIAAAIARHELTAAQLTEAALARIAATEPEVNAFIHIDTDGARAAAEALDRRLASGDRPGPLAGVPVSVKDLVHVAGMPTTGGSAVSAAGPVSADAAPVARLRAAGAIIIGKTTTPEYGHKPLTESPLFGRTLNPWNRHYTAGGSSGGAAACLAARQVPLAIGTDGGGSIRIPASVCGVWGLKATLGRIPHVHAPDLFGNGSYIGPMARDVDDLELMYRIMAVADPRDPWARRQPVHHAADRGAILTIGYARTVGNSVLEPALADAFDDAIRAIEAAGHRVRPIEIDLARYEPAFRTQLESVLAARFSASVRDNRDHHDRSFVVTVENGLRHRGIDLAAANAARTALFHEIERLFEQIDLLVTPTVAAASLPADTDPHAPVQIAGQSCGPIRAGWYPYTFPFNMTGHPALSMPCGWDDHGLPIGLQIVGGWDEEDRMLVFARELATRLAVPRRMPGLVADVG
ncbi:MAG: amidase [Burkholderiaceae bacterium]